jgi:lipopolysaccharide heptosyltransferase I
MDNPDKKFLIVKLSSLGDVVHNLPVLRTLRKNFPKSFIAWVVEEKCQDVLYNNPDLDELIVLRTKHWRRHWNRRSFSELFSAIGRIRRRRFDVVFDFQGLAKSGLIARLSGAPERVGFHRRDCRECLNAWFTNRKAPPVGKGVHVIDKNLSLLQTVGVSAVVKEFPLAVPAVANEYVASYLKNNPDLMSNPVAVINPGVGFKTKQWDLGRFAQLADRIAGDLGYHILLTWGPGEEGKIKTIAAQMRQRHWIAPPTNIHQSIALFRHISLFVSCDTGPLHLCSVMGIPTVSIFGPTDPARNGPYGGSIAVLRSPRAVTSYKRAREIDLSMREVAPDSVFEALKAHLIRRAAGCAVE